MLVYFHFRFALLLQWLASRFMEHLRMSLANYKFKFYCYFPLRETSKFYQFCEHSPFLYFNDQFAAFNTCWKTKLTLISEKTLTFSLYS